MYVATDDYVINTYPLLGDDNLKLLALLIIVIVFVSFVESIVNKHL